MGDIWKTTDSGKFVYQNKNLLAKAVCLKLELLYVGCTGADIYRDLKGQLSHKQILDFRNGSGLPPAHMQLIKDLINWNKEDEAYYQSVIEANLIKILNRRNKENYPQFNY